MTNVCFLAIYLVTLDRSQFAALTSPAHIIYTSGVKTVTKASLKWSLNPALVPTPHIAGKEKRKDIWDFIDSNNRNLTTRFGSDLSVVSRIKPLFDCVSALSASTISDWHRAITWLWQFPNWSGTFIRHLKLNSRKSGRQGQQGSLNITNDNDWVISRQSGGGLLIASREEMEVF